MTDNNNNGAAALNTSGYNWGEALKVDIGDLKNVSTAAGGTRPPLKPVAPGRYAAFLQEAKPTTYKTGAFGIKTTYVIEEGEFKNRKITDNIILTKKDGSKTPYGANTLKKRLMAFGLPMEKILAFKGPRNEHDLGDFRLVLSAAVTIIVKADGEYNGRPSVKVAGVYIRAEAGNEQAA